MAIQASGFNCSCDICDSFLHVPGLTETYTRGMLARHGWECTDLDICKRCVEKRDAGNDGILLLINQRREKKRAAAETQPGG